ncbi:hypothetical protein ACI2KR_07445 [Pseudomonas luteola]
MNTRYSPYTGVGFEDVKEREGKLIYDIAFQLAASGYTLRAGGYSGCSKFFEEGANKAFKSPHCKGRSLSFSENLQSLPIKEVFLPYRGFQNHDDDSFYDYPEEIKIRVQKFLNSKPLSELIEQGENPFVLKDIISRIHQLLGRSLSLKSKSRFLLCWTPDGAHSTETVSSETGNTSKSIILAEHFGIKVFNLGNSEHFERISGWISSFNKALI